MFVTNAYGVAKDESETIEGAINYIGFGADPQIFSGSAGVYDRAAYLPANPERVVDGVLTPIPKSGKGKDAVSMNDETAPSEP